MAIGFWKFVLVASILIALLRGGSNPLGNFFSTLPLSVFMWIGYRVARLQPWWPFGKPIAESLSRIGALKPGTSRASNPISSDALRRMAQQTMAAKHNARESQIAASHSRRLSIRTPAPEPEVFKALSEPSSSVGTRSKSVRSKTTRYKTVRSKRRPSLS
jgi:hypothetical protein